MWTGSARGGIRYRREKRSSGTTRGRQAQQASAAESPVERFTCVLNEHQRMYSEIVVFRTPLQPSVSRSVGNTSSSASIRRDANVNPFRAWQNSQFADTRLCRLMHHRCKYYPNLRHWRARAFTSGCRFMKRCQSRSRRREFDSHWIARDAWSTLSALSQWPP